MATRLSKAQVNSWRLSRQHLASRAKRRDLATVVSEVCGIQSQVLSAAELAVHERVEGITRQDIRDALWKDHSILKTWCMRGTLHLLASNDLPIYVAALKTKLVASKLWLQKNHNISPAEVDQVTHEIGRALEKDPLTREQLAQVVQSRGKFSEETKKALRSAWGILLSPAAYQGLLAFGPSLGPKVTFIKPAGKSARKEPPITEAFRELFRKFLRSHGPAALRDFDHWWGNIPDDVWSTLEGEKESLESVDVDGFRGLMLGSDAEKASKIEPVHVVRLLPSFDSYVMFCSPREWVVPTAHRNRIFNKLAGWVFPSVIVDGTAVGIWNLKKRGRNVEVNVEPFRKLASREKVGIEREATRIGEFLESRVEVSYSSGSIS